MKVSYVSLLILLLHLMLPNQYSLSKSKINIGKIFFKKKNEGKKKKKKNLKFWKWAKYERSHQRNQFQICT